MKYENDKDSFMEAQIDLFEKEKYHPSLGVIPLLLQIPIILGLVQVIGNPANFINDITNTIFLGMDLSVIPIYPSDICMPILAAITTILLCLFQNRLNVLQREESLVSKLLTGLLTVILTVYFVFYVPNGVGLYWVLGNVLGIIQLYILNYIFPPKKYVDYNYLEKVKKARIEKETKEKIAKKQSKYYYKKFFEEENVERMKLLFYSEGSGFFKYYKGMIEYILNNSDITIHYVTSDINDKIFEYDNPNLIPYFIDTNRLIPLFMKLECDIVVMTTPELQNLYLKRSIIKKDIEYIFRNYYTTSLKNIKISVLFQEISSIAKRNNLRLASDFTMLIRTMVIVEGLVTELSPELNIISLVIPYVKDYYKEYFLSEFDVNDYLLKGYKLTRDTLNIPSKFVALSDTLIKGRGKVNIVLEDKDKYIDVLNKMVNRLAFALVIAGMVVASSLIINTNPDPKIYGISVIGMGGYFVSAILGLWLLISIIRSGSLK